jgi:hypothetical protein
MAFQTDAGTIGLWRFESGKWEMIAAIMSWNSDGGKDWVNDKPPAFGLEIIVTRNDDKGLPLFRPGEKYDSVVAKRFDSENKPWPDLVSDADSVHQAINRFAKRLEWSKYTAFRVDTVYDYVLLGNRETVPPLDPEPEIHAYDVHAADVPIPIRVGKLHLAKNSPLLFEHMVVKQLSGLRHRLPGSLSDLMFLKPGKPEAEMLDVGDWIRAHSFFAWGGSMTLKFSAKWPKWYGYRNDKTGDLPKAFNTDTAAPGFDRYDEFFAEITKEENTPYQIEAQEGQITNEPWDRRFLTSSTSGGHLLGRAVAASPRTI